MRGHPSLTRPEDCRYRRQPARNEPAVQAALLGIGSERGKAVRGAGRNRRPRWPDPPGTPELGNGWDGRDPMRMAKSSCPLSQSQFLAQAEPLKVSINAQEMLAEVKAFSTGSFGWYLNGKTTVMVDGKAVSIQIGLPRTSIYRLYSAEAEEQMVGQEPETLEGTRSRWPARTGRPRCGSNGKPLRGTSADPGATGLCCEGNQDERQGLAILSAAGAHLPT